MLQQRREVKIWWKQSSPQLTTTKLPGHESDTLIQQYLKPLIEKEEVIIDLFPEGIYEGLKYAGVWRPDQKIASEQTLQTAGRPMLYLMTRHNKCFVAKKTWFSKLFCNYFLL